MIRIFGLLFTVSVNLALIFFFVTLTRGFHLFRKYEKGSGILTRYNLYLLLKDLKDLERKGELPDEEVKTYHDMRRGYNIVICVFLVSLFIWLLMLLCSVISNLQAGHC